VGFGAVYEHYLPSGLFCSQTFTNPAHLQVTQAVGRLWLNRKVMQMDLKSASIALAKELSSKKFPRKNHAAYLSCFLNIGTIDNFLSALELERRPTKRVPDAGKSALKKRSGK